MEQPHLIDGSSQVRIVRALQYNNCQFPSTIPTLFCLLGGGVEERERERERGGGGDPFYLHVKDPNAFHISSF